MSTLTKLHPSIVLRTIKGHEWFATEYWDTRAMKAGRPYIYKDMDATDIQPEGYAGRISDMHTLNQKRWTEKRARPKRHKIVKQLDPAIFDELEHLMKDRQNRALNEIEAAWLDTREPSWPAVKHIKNKEWEKAAAIFSHA